jgi:hypothetical protein
MVGFADTLLAVFMLASAGLITLWMAGAIYYDWCQEARFSCLLAGAWILGTLLLFAAWQPLWQPFAVLLAVAALFLAWWLRQKPSQDREWDAAVARLPWGTRVDEAVTIENVRNFDYRSPQEFTARYQTRTLRLANLQSADILFFTWGSSWMSHPALVFDFGPDGRICVSIEVRYRKGQKYSVLRSIYRQQELTFVVADERDVILRRTKHARNQNARMYRMNASAEELRHVFLDYLEAVNHLYDQPRWYHGVCANCTTTFYRLPHSRFRLDWRVLANGRLDAALYQSGRLDRTVPLPELRRISHLNEIANRAPEEGFGDFIRRELDERRQAARRNESL